MTVTGDFAKLKNLVKTLDIMREPEFKKGLVANLAAEAQNQIAEGFQTETDPYGVKWKPSHRAATEGGITLSDRGILRNSFQLTRVSERGFTIMSKLKYSGIHQRGGTIKPKKKKALRFQIGGQWFIKGAVKIPQRRMVPDNDNLGPKWSEALGKAGLRYVEYELQRRGIT